MLPTLSKRTTGGIVLLAILVSGAFAQSASVAYFEGEPELQRASGEAEVITFGAEVSTEDAVVTGTGDFVELRLTTGGTVQVQSNTVFRIDEISENGQPPVPVLRTTVGSVRVALGDRIRGTAEPRIATASAAAGVRGTEFLVFAGQDGSSLFVVEQGLVVVSGGENGEVELGPEQAVEVNTDGRLGERFQVRRGSINFQDWNRGRLQRFEEEPVAIMREARQRMSQLIQEIRDLRQSYDRLSREIDELRIEARRLADEGMRDEAAQLFAAEIEPRQLEASYRLITLRYTVNTAINLRTFVIAPLNSRGQALLIRDAERLRDFSGEYRQIVREYGEVVAPEIRERDFLFDRPRGER